MKHYKLLSILALSTFGIAYATSNSLDNLNFDIGIYQNYNGASLKTLETELSKSNKKQFLCYFVSNIKPNQKFHITTRISSPKGARFKGKDSDFSFNKDQTEHRLNYDFSNKENKDSLDFCWNFDKRDPSGDYNIKVVIENKEYPSFSFKLTE